MTALEAKADGTVIPQVIGEMRNMEVPESFVFGTPDRYEEKNIDSVIQFMNTGRSGASDRSRASRAAVGYSTDHAVHRQDEQ